MVFLLTRTHSVVRVSDADAEAAGVPVGGWSERKREKGRGKKRPEP
jgi:hypothetical protein